MCGIALRHHSSLRAGSAKSAEDHLRLPARRGRVSRTGAILVLEPRRLIVCKTRAQLVPRYALAPVELGQAALDLGVDSVFIFLQPDLAFALYFQRIEEHVFHTLERSATQPLLNERLDFRTFYFDGHGATLWQLFCPHPTAGLAF